MKSNSTQRFIMLRLDLHCHSCYSEDAEGTPKTIIQHLQKRGIHGVAITDHNTMEGAIKAKKIAPKNFIVIPAVEISTKDGHLLGFNISTIPPKGLSVNETVDHILDQGGIPIVPHVFRNMSGIKEKNLLTISQKLSTMEVFNACSMPKTNLRSGQLAKKLQLGGTGGSDSHHPAYAGEAYTLVDTTDFSVDSILSEIQKKKTWGVGSTMPFNYRQDRMMKSIKQFFQRGLQRI